MRQSLFSILLLGLMLALSKQAFSLTLPDAPRQNLTPQLEILHDTSGTRTIEEVAGPSRDALRAAGEPVVHLGLSMDPVWGRLLLENPGGATSRVLVVQNPRLKDVQLYERRADGTWAISRSGTDYPFYSRQILHPEPAFLLRFAPGETKELFLRVQNSGSLRFSTALFEPIAFHHFVTHWTAYTFLLLGAFVAMGLYNFLVFLSLRERGYLYLSLLIAVFLLFQMSLSGTAHMYLWPNSPWWSNHSLTFLVMISIVIAVVFTNAVLNVYKLAPWLARLALVFAGIAFMTAILSLTDWQGKYFFSHSLGFIMPALIMLIAYRCWRRGYRPAGYFILAWGMGVLGSVMLSLLGPGWIPSNLVTEHLAELGFMAAVFLWSFTLSNRVVEKEERQRAALEQAVQERTAELEQSLADVKTLQGLLPICSGCKKIRDDTGYWSEVEEYFSRHTGADFSHGLCPGCAVRLYPQFFKTSTLEEEQSQEAAL